jgi:glycosyltransferase involved in cell wall biosynthesis
VSGLTGRRESPHETGVVAGIPAFNEEQTIAKVVARTLKHVDKVLVVDDGSSDDTALIAERLGADVIPHGKNLGKGAALRTCFKWAKRTGAKVLVTLDADGQHNPDEIPRLVDPVLKGEADVVIGSRRHSKDMPALRRFGAKLLDRATGVKVGGTIVDAQSGYRAYSRTALERVTAAEQGMGVDSEIIVKARDAGLRIVEVPVTAKYKGLETSTYNPVYHGFDVFFSILKFMSIRHPLLFYGGFSAIMFTVAIIFGIQTLDFYARWGRVVTNLALVSVAAGIMGFLSFFTGVILFTLITVLREKG